MAQNVGTSVDGRDSTKSLHKLPKTSIMADEERRGPIATAGTKVMAHSLQGRERHLCSCKHSKRGGQGGHRP